MSLPGFDATKHHIGLGPFGAVLGFVLDGGYGKAFKRDASDELAGVHYGGGDGLVNQAGLSTWTMDDFTGGAYQHVWGRDPKMFSDCAGLLPAQFDRSLRTVPPLWLRSSYGSPAPGQVKPKGMYAWGGFLNVCLADRLERFSLTSPGTHTEFLYSPGAVICNAAPDYRTGLFFTGTTIGGTRKLLSVNPADGTYNNLDLPAGAITAGGITGVAVSADRLFFAVADVLGTVTLTDSVGNPFDTDITRIGRLPGRWVDSAWLNQQLYIVCGGSDTPAQVVACDGVSVLPVTDLPFNFVPECICAYAGRVYVGGSGRDISDGRHYGELYEITGSSVRLVRTFAPEVRSNRYAAPSSIHSMAVHEGLLFFGQSSVGMVAYDVTTDAFYGAQQFAADFGAATRDVQAVISARERLWCWVVNSSTPAETGLWSGLVEGDAGTGVSWSGQLVTSDFAPELDRLKRWKRLRILTRGDVVQPTLAWSVDSGSNYTVASLESAAEVSGYTRLSTFDLSAVPASRQNRFRITLPRGTSISSFAELVAFTSSFTLVDSADLHGDGTEKLAWSVTVNGTETIELEDGSGFVQQLKLLRDQLWSWATERTELVYTDTDGSGYTVKIDSMREHQPYVLPPVKFDDRYDPGAPGDPALGSELSGREAFYNLTLVEV